MSIRHKRLTLSIILLIQYSAPLNVKLQAIYTAVAAQRSFAFCMDSGAFYLARKWGERADSCYCQRVHYDKGENDELIRDKQRIMLFVHI